MLGRSNYLPYFTLKWLLLHTLVVRRALRQSSNLQGLSREGRDREKARSVFLCCSSSDIFFWKPDEYYSRDLYYMYLLRSNTLCLHESQSQIDPRTKIELVGELLQILENVLFGKMHFLTLGKVSS